MLRGVCSTKLKSGIELLKETEEKVDDYSKYCQSETVIRAAENVLASYVGTPVVIVTSIESLEAAEAPLSWILLVVILGLLVRRTAGGEN